MQTTCFNRKMAITRTVTLLLLCIGALSIQAQPTAGRGDTGEVITIPFGQQDTLRYSMNTGTYTVLFHGKAAIHEAYAVYEGRHATRSTQPGFRHHLVSSFKDERGTGKKHSFRLESDSVWLWQDFFVYTGQPFIAVQVMVQGKKGIASRYISPLTTPQITLPGTGDQRGLAVPYDNDMWVRYDAQPLEKANYISSEVTAIYNNDSRGGLVIGSLQHSIWKSGIKVQAAGHHTVSLAAFGGLSDSVITHDKIPHGLVSELDTGVRSPKIMIGYYDDWRTGMEQYAAMNRATEKPRLSAWKKATPTGWNSWGALQTKLTLEKAKRVVDFFSDSCKGFRNADNTLYIDLDSYWDNLVKGGLNGDVGQLSDFVKYCRRNKFKPGIYWGPFTDWGKYDRTIEGSSFRYAPSWITQKGVPVEVDGARAMDPTYPGTKERILHYINRFKELGFGMIKIDFLGHGALESDRYHDPAVTTGMQAYRAGMEFLDSVLDNKMLVYAAISPTMATGRYVHMRRIACDAFSAIDNSEYTLNSTGYGWWQSHLYDYVDADHVVFNKETAGAQRARLASALVTGTLITGDDFSAAGEWNQAAKRLLQNKELLNIIKDGRPFRPVEANSGRRAPELFVRTINGTTYLAVFNYDKAGKTFTVPVERLERKKGSKLLLKELFSNNTITATGQLLLTVPAADAVIYKIIP